MLLVCEMGLKRGFRKDWLTGRGNTFLKVEDLLWLEVVCPIYPPISCPCFDCLGKSRSDWRKFKETFYGEVATLKGRSIWLSGILFARAK